MNDRFAWTRLIIFSVTAVVVFYFMSAIVIVLIAGNLDAGYALGISDEAVNAIPVASGALLAAGAVALVSGVRGWWIGFVMLCSLAIGLAAYGIFVAFGFEPGSEPGMAAWVGELIAIIGATRIALGRLHID